MDKTMKRLDNDRKTIIHKLFYEINKRRKKNRKMQTPAAALIKQIYMNKEFKVLKSPRTYINAFLQSIVHPPLDRNSSNATFI